MFHFENNIIVTKYTPLNKIYNGGIGYFCFSHMKKHKDNIAEIDASTNKQETYGSLLTKSIRTSLVLQEKGVKRGDIIAIYSKVQLSASVPMLSCFFIGAIPTFIDSFMLTKPEILNLLKQLNPKLVLTTADLVDTIETILKNETCLNTDIVILDEENWKQHEKEDTFEPIYVKNLNDIALIPFSSGSTGLPKGICLSHYSLLYTNVLDDGSYWLKDENKILFGFDSFHWSLAIVLLVCCIKEGICRIIDPQEFNAKRTWHLLDKYNVNLAFFRPYNIMEMCSMGKPEYTDIGKLTTIIATGSILPKDHHKQIQKLLPSVDVFLLYGQTEVGSITKFRKCDLHREYNRRKPGSVGLPLDGYGISYKVIDIDTGECLGPNKHGELYVKTNTVMLSYYNIDSSDQFDEDGFIKTGDIVFYDEDFCFFVVDRNKDMMLFRGQHVPPAFIENVLLTHPAVKRAAVIGVPHKIDGEHPLGLVVLKNSSENVTANDIKKYVNEKMSDGFQLRAGVKFLEESYFTSGNKVKKYFLKKLVLGEETK